MLETPRHPRRAFKETYDKPDRISGPAILASPGDQSQGGLVGAPLPPWIKPCLPTLVDAPPVGEEWVHEIK